MHMSSESLLIILVVGLVAGWLAGQIIQGTGFGLISDLIRWRLAPAATRHSPWLGHDLRNHRCHYRRVDSVADHENSSRRKWMASKIRKGLE